MKGIAYEEKLLSFPNPDLPVPIASTTDPQPCTIANQPGSGQNRIKKKGRIFMPEIYKLVPKTYTVTIIRTTCLVDKQLKLQIPIYVHGEKLSKAKAMHIARKIYPDLLKQDNLFKIEYERRKILIDLEDMTTMTVI